MILELEINYQNGKLINTLMKYLKLFEEIGIKKEEFPNHGNELSTRETKILTDLVGLEHLDKFIIRVDDYYYYTIHYGYYNRFNDLNNVKDYIVSYFFMYERKKKEYLELLKRSNLDPSFDDNYPIKWASKEGYVEIVKHLLNDKRVDPSHNNNWAIRMATYFGLLVDTHAYKNIVKLLLKDQKVSSKLTEEDNNEIQRFLSRPVGL